MSLAPVTSPATAFDLLRLAFDHHRLAQKLSCPIERQRYSRAATIYAVLASFDIPIAAFPACVGHLPERID
jgi:hypothetical protein